MDSDGVVLIFAERDKLGKESVVVFVGMIFALVFTRNEELIIVVVFVKRCIIMKIVAEK